MPFIDLNGARLHYRQRGDGPVAVFIHGFPLDSTMWLDQLERLEDIRTCVAIDLRGFGESSPITASTLPMADHADDVAAVVEHLGGSADVVGLSMGGYVALALAQLHPTLMRSLVLVDTRARADDDEGKAGRNAAITAVLDRGRRQFAGELEGALLGPDPSPTIRGRLRSMIEATRYETLTAALAGMRDRPDRTPILQSIRVPTLVLVGEHDRLTPPSDARAMAAQLPIADIEVIAGAGHMSPMEAPDAVGAALRRHFARVDS